MSTLIRVKPLFALFLLLTLLAAAGCRRSPSAPTSLPPSASPATLQPSQTPPLPSPTPPPLAVRVNDGGVLLADYQAELARYQAAQQTLGKQVTPEAAREAVLAELVSQELLAQAARAAGQEASDDALQTRLDQLAAQMGGQAALDTWTQANGYTAETLRAALRLAVLAGWQRDQIVAAVPAVTEQIHARQILVLEQTEADQIAAQLQAGADFVTLAYRYDPLTGGELGWFPRGTLLQPEVEQAVFALQPGQVTPVVASSIGYHLVLVSERESDRALDATNRQILQQEALRAWLEERRAQSQIEVLIP